MDQRFQISHSVDEVWSFHSKKLEENEARFNLILGLMNRQRKKPVPLTFYSFDRPGALALQYPEHNLVLGDLNHEEVVGLAKSLKHPIPGVIGADDLAKWFVEAEPRKVLAEISQKIYQVKKLVTVPKVGGRHRLLQEADRENFLKWIKAFHDEATPHDPPISEEKILSVMEDRIFFIWEFDGIARGLAGIVRENSASSVVGPVYVPPEERRNGYGEAVTAALTNYIFASGKKSVVLYTDASNPTSNKIYEKIGYEIVCKSRCYSLA